MTIIITPTTQKVKHHDVESFMETENSKLYRKRKSENTQKDIDKKNTLEIYRALCRPLNEQALSAIVKNT